MSTNMDLKEWFALLKRVRGDRIKACESIEDQIKFLQEELDAKSKPFDDQMAAIEGEIKASMMERGESFRCNDGAASFRKGYPKVTYSAKALDIVCQRHPIVKELIWHNRRETMVDPSVHVEVF